MLNFSQCMGIALRIIHDYAGITMERADLLDKADWNSFYDRKVLAYEDDDTYIRIRTYTNHNVTWIIRYKGAENSGRLFPS